MTEPMGGHQHHEGDPKCYCYKPPATEQATDNRAEWERVHVQNCGCHNLPTGGDPCHAWVYGNKDHHEHPFTDSGCVDLRTAVQKAIDERDTIHWQHCSVCGNGGKCEEAAAAEKRAGGGK